MTSDDPKSGDGRIPAEGPDFAKEGLDIDEPTGVDLQAGNDVDTGAAIGGPAASPADTVGPAGTPTSTGAPTGNDGAMGEDAPTGDASLARPEDAVPGAGDAPVADADEDAAQTPMEPGDATAAPAGAGADAAQGAAPDAAGGGVDPETGLPTVLPEARPADRSAPLP